jgi:hypothetical protein
MLEKANPVMIAPATGAAASTNAMVCVPIPLAENPA